MIGIPEWANFVFVIHISFVHSGLKVFCDGHRVDGTSLLDAEVFVVILQLFHIVRFAEVQASVPESEVAAQFLRSSTKPNQIHDIPSQSLLVVKRDAL